MPSSTRGAVYRAVRFSVPVTFSVLTGRAGHPGLRDDVGIVPYTGGGGVRFSGPVAYRRLLKNSKVR